MGNSFTDKKNLSLSSIVSLHHISDEDFARAWLLAYGPSQYFALPLQACHEIVESPKIIEAPGVARYALGLLSWRDEWLPLIDMHALVTGSNAKNSDNSHYLIVAYRNLSGNINFAALSLNEFPQVIEVQDDAICALPSSSNFNWSKIAVSCFRHFDNRVPVVESSNLFGQYHQISI